MPPPMITSHGDDIIGVRERYANPVGLACFFMFFFKIGIHSISTLTKVFPRIISVQHFMLQR